MTNKCTNCGQKCANRTGLAAHLRFQHNLRLDGTKWGSAASKINRTEPTTEKRGPGRPRINGMTLTTTTKNGTSSTYQFSTPSNPSRHLETALTEIDARLKVIQTEITRARALETEQSALLVQREQITQILRPGHGSAQVTPKEVVRELANA